MTLENESTVTENEIDPFEAAFKEIAALEEQGKVDEYSPESKISKDATEEVKSTEQVVDGNSDDTGTEDTSETVAETTEQEEHTETEEKPDPTKDLLNKFSEIIDKSNQTVKEPEKPQVQQQEQPLEIYSIEEKEFLNTYAKDWQDVVKGEALVRKREYHDLLGYVFKEVADQIRPMMETLQTLSERTHLSDLQAQVTDYSDVRGKVIEWVGTQPTYLRTAYEHVIKEGTVDEVKDLIDRYKKETGTGIISPKTEIKQPAKTEISEATKQAAAILAPVGSKRSTVTVSGPDANDFDSAFALFSKED